MAPRPIDPDDQTGAALLVAALVRSGIDTVFGVPGDTGIYFYDSLARRSDQIRHVLARDERHAGYMADGYARSSRRLAVCEASSGAGAVYLASGLGEAYASSIPVLAITTDIQQRSRGTGAITEIDQLALFSAVTKWRRVVDRAADIPALVADAVDAATTGRPAPVALVLPEDVLEESAAVEPVKAPGSALPPRRPRAGQAEIDAVVAALATARQPAILAGGGVHMSGAWRALTRLCRHAGIPVATTIHGKGAIAEDHPMSLGVAGGNGCRGYANEYLQGCDAVVIVGSRANSTDTNGYTSPPRAACRIAQIDIDPSRAGCNYPGSLALVGDASTVLDQIAVELPALRPELKAARRSAIAEARAAWAEREAVPPPVPDGRLHARDVVRVLHRVLGGRTWVVADPGTPTPYAAAYWESAGDGWRVIIPRGHGPMGFASSAAIGVAIAHPGERVLCLTTESSLAMGVADWETAHRLRLPITYVVLDNVSMAWIKMLQHLYLGGRYFGVEPGPIDPVLLAGGMGLPGRLVTDLDQLELAAKESVAGKPEGPCAIHVRVPEHIDTPPPVAAWQAALSGASSARPVY